MGYDGFANVGSTIGGEMKPYFQDEWVTLYHGDCLKITEWLNADVLVTDPPYGMSYISNSAKDGPSEAIAGDDTTDLRDSVLEMWGDKSALVFGTWRVPRPLKTKQLIIWDKGDSPGMGDLAIPWGPSHEDIYVLGNTAGFVGKRGGAVIRAKTLSPGSHSRPNHPTPKPIGLMENLISNTKGIVADPFAGSGATLIAARNLGRKVIGVELEEKYCDLIANRLSQQTFQFELV